MTSTTGVGAGVRPTLHSEPQTTDVAPRPGYDFWGRALKDPDVWGGIKTPEGKTVNTGDGIDEAEMLALTELAEKDTVQFLHRLGADSKNGTPITYRREDPIGTAGTAFSVFTARDGKLVVEVGVELKQEAVQGWLRGYLAPPEKQITAPVVGKITLTGAINRQGEITDLKASSSLANMPKLSTDKIAGFERYAGAVLRSLPTGETVSEEMRKLVGELVAAVAWRASFEAVELARGLVQDEPAWKIEISRDETATAAHVKAGNYALGVRIDHLIDVFSKNYPRIDASANASLDPADTDTFDLGIVKAESTERLVATFEGNEARLYRIEKDGSRTRLNNLFGDILVGLPFLLSRA